MNKMSKMSAVLPVVIGITLTLMFVGCGSIGMMASKTKTFMGKDSIILQAPEQTFLTL